MLADACVVVAPLALFGIWMAVIGLCYWSVLFLRALSARMRTLLLSCVLVLGLSAPLLATSPEVNDPARCAWLISLGTPCWLLQAMWCPCDIPPPPPDGF